MTVETQMQQAIAGIQSAAATMKTFALLKHRMNRLNRHSSK